VEQKSNKNIQCKNILRRTALTSVVAVVVAVVAVVVFLIIITAVGNKNKIVEGLSKFQIAEIISSTSN
jgi:hypothetical protein